MAHPCNKHDYEVFLKLAELLSKQYPPAELSVYTGSKDDHDKGGCYVNIELKGNVPYNDLLACYGVEKQTETVAPADETDHLIAQAERGDFDE